MISQQNQDFEKKQSKFAEIPEEIFSEIRSNNDFVEEQIFNMRLLLRYPQLSQLQNQQSQINKQSLKRLAEDYVNNENSIPNISFHYNLDGSHAILFNIYCEKEFLQKVMNQIDQSYSLFYDSKAMNFVVLKTNKPDVNIQNNINNHNNNSNIQNISNIFEGQRQFMMFQTQYPSFTRIKNQKELNYEQLKNFTTAYETHDQSLSDISFHYNADGSQAILFSLFCQQEIIQKTIKQRDDFDSLYYDLDSMNVLLIKERSMILEDFDAYLQQYDNNSLPLTTYLSIKYEEQKKYLNNLGIYQKKNLSQISTIPNLRLRQDLFELYECLNNDLEFDDLYQDQYCYAYYTQSDNPFLLEGLIVGPENTPYKGVVYTLTIKVHQDYPNTPPDVYFNQNVLHPNVSEKGSICLDILNNKWSPALTIQKVLISIVSLLHEKNLDDVYNHYAKCLYIENPVELKKQILQQAVFSGCKKADINYEEVSKLSSQSKRKNILQCDYEDEYDYTNQEAIEDNDYDENE